MESIYIECDNLGKLNVVLSDALQVFAFIVFLTVYSQYWLSLLEETFIQGVNYY